MSSNSYAIGPRLDVGDGATRVANRGRPASERRGPAGTCAPSGEGLGSRDAGSARQALAARLALRIGEAVDAALVGVSSSSVAGADDEAHRQLLAGWREVLSVCLKCGLAAIELGKAGDAPAIVAVQAERAARLGVGVSVGIGRYHLAYETAWDFVVEEVSAMPLRDEDRTALMAEAALASASLLANVLAAAATAHAESRN